MDTILGDGDHRYRVDKDWGRIPEDWSLGDVAGLGVDSKDRVYVFSRSDHPMIVLDREGNLLDEWGVGTFTAPHAVHVGPDDAIYCTDASDHTVRKCSPTGKVLLTLGIPGSPAARLSGLPFCKCTHTALSPAGDIYVSDGYGNARVHKFSPNGEHLFSWGEPGTKPGQFNLPHNICCDDDGWVYVADRENHRIQVFDGNGRYETQWNNLHRPSGICIVNGKCPFCYVGEVGPYMQVNRGVPNLGPRISILSRTGELLAQLNTNPAAGTDAGQFLSPHGIAVDSLGDLYIGEVGVTAWPSLFPGKPAPPRLRCLQKLVKL
jgi:hypothetical protein